MTVFAKDTTYGLETKVKEFQNYLNSELSILWGGDLHIYGLIYKTLDNEGNTKPEAYTGAGIGQKEYSEVFINDKIACSVGFIIQDRETLPDRVATIDLVFTLLIDKIYSTTTRDTERALLQAQKVVEGFGAVLQIQDVTEGIEDVFAGFYTEPIKHRDMHPWYVFSLSIDLPYSDDSCQ